MLLLRFTFANHKSFREEVDLTLVQPRLRTNTPPEGSTWTDFTSRVAAIYGANASGKSGVLDALRYMLAQIENSATLWAQRKNMTRAPYLLDEVSGGHESSYSLDFVWNGVRYEYGFSVGEKAIEGEWLYSYPTTRRKTIFERTAPKPEMEDLRGLGEGAAMLRKTTGPRELVLSKGVLNQQPFLSDLAEALLDGILIASFGESDREGRLRTVIKDVADGTLAVDDLRTMLKVADIGIADAEVAEGDADPHFKKLVQALIVAQSDSEGVNFKVDEIDLASVDEEMLEHALVELGRSLMFQHSGVGDRTYALRSADQSTGTLTWLSLAAPAIKTLREGSVFLVDELDASLHPQLAQVMVQMFRDPELNHTGAQLVFTTHDTFFMSPTSEVALSADEVWFVEKDRQGVSDLYRLSDYETRVGHNFSRRYLQGRYGALPSVAPSFLKMLVDGGA